MSINQSQSHVEGSTSTIPSFTLDARNKFAPQLIRLLADLSLSHSDTDAADYLALNELASEMEEWHSENAN